MGTRHGPGTRRRRRSTKRGTTARSDPPWCRREIGRSARSGPRPPRAGGRSRRAAAVRPCGTASRTDAANVDAATAADIAGREAEADGRSPLPSPSKSTSASVRRVAAEGAPGPLQESARRVVVRHSGSLTSAPNAEPLDPIHSRRTIRRQRPGPHGDQRSPVQTADGSANTGTKALFPLADSHYCCRDRIRHGWPRPGSTTRGGRTVAKTAERNEPPTADTRLFFGAGSGRTILEELREGQPWSKVLWIAALLVGLLDVVRWHHGAGFAADSFPAWQSAHGILHGHVFVEWLRVPARVSAHRIPAGDFPVRSNEVPGLRRPNSRTGLRVLGHVTGDQDPSGFRADRVGSTARRALRTTRHCGPLSRTSPCCSSHWLPASSSPSIVIGPCPPR